MTATDLEAADFEKDPDYKAPYNTLFNIPRVFTPDDKAIQTPNSDTPYSWSRP